MCAIKTEESGDACLFYTSKTFTILADKYSGLYLKPWREIYEMLKRELS